MTRTSRSYRLRIFWSLATGRPPMIRSCACFCARGNSSKTPSMRRRICSACARVHSVRSHCWSSKSRCRRAWARTTPTSCFICRSTRLRPFLWPARRACCDIAILSRFMRPKNCSGASMRPRSPAWRISNVAFINVRTPSRNNTQSVGKWRLAFTQVLSRKYSSRSTASFSPSFRGCSTPALSKPSMTARIFPAGSQWAKRWTSLLEGTRTWSSASTRQNH